MVVYYLRICCISTILYAEDERVLAVPNIEGKNVPEHIVSTCRNMVEAAIIQTDIFQVISYNDVEQILEAQAFSLSGCTDESCAIEIGELLAAENIVVGELTGLTDEKMILALRLIDVTTGKSVKAEIVNIDSYDEMKSRIFTGAYKLVGAEYKDEDSVPIDTGGPAEVPGAKDLWRFGVSVSFNPWFGEYNVVPGSGLPNDTFDADYARFYNEFLASIFASIALSDHWWISMELQTWDIVPGFSYKEDEVEVHYSGGLFEGSFAVAPSVRYVVTPFIPFRLMAGAGFRYGFLYGGSLYTYATIDPLLLPEIETMEDFTFSDGFHIWDGFLDAGFELLLSDYLSILLMGEAHYIHYGRMPRLPDLQPFWLFYPAIKIGVGYRV